MYYDDRFHPVHGSDLDPTAAKKQTQGLTDSIKSLDKNYHCIRVDIPGKPGKAKIEYFNSQGCGNPIRNAITGERYRDKLVGSKCEDAFFKICIPHAEGGNNTLFYESPEAFERHQYTTLDEKTKAAWKLKNDAYMLRVA